VTGQSNPSESSKLPPYVSRIDGETYRLNVWVQPGAKVTGTSGTYQQCLKVKLKAPPVDNKANRELEAFLAKKLGLKPRDIVLISGQSSRKKILHITMGENSSWSL